MDKENEQLTRRDFLRGFGKAAAGVAAGAVVASEAIIALAGEEESQSSRTERIALYASQLGRAFIPEAELHKHSEGITDMPPGRYHDATRDMYTVVLESGCFARNTYLRSAIIVAQGLQEDLVFQKKCVPTTDPMTIEKNGKMFEAKTGNKTIAKGRMNGLEIICEPEI